MTRILIYSSPLIVAAFAWFGFSYFVVRSALFGLAMPIIVTYLVCFPASSIYVVTNSRVIGISAVLPPRVLYVNLINELGGPVQIKLGRIDGIRFGPWFPREEDKLTRIVGGRVASLSFLALEDHTRVYNLALSAQRAAVTL